MVIVVASIVVSLLIVLKNSGKFSSSSKTSGGASSSSRAYSGAKGPSVSSRGNAGVLKNYVRKSLSKGFTRAQIEKVLLAKGWSKRDIDNAFK